MGADMICIKDMANLLLPMDAYSLVKALKETVSVPIHLHTHNTSGTGDMTLLMAAYAGVDIVDTALSARWPSVFRTRAFWTPRSCGWTPTPCCIRSPAACSVTSFPS